MVPAAIERKWTVAGDGPLICTAPVLIRCHVLPNGSGVRIPLLVSVGIGRHGLPSKSDRSKSWRRVLTNGPSSALTQSQST
jgi:hypothetical protein